MQIFVNGIGLHGYETISLDTNLSGTIRSIKTKIEVIDGIPPSDQRHLYAGEHLKDDNMLYDYNVSFNRCYAFAPTEDVANTRNIFVFDHKRSTIIQLSSNHEKPLLQSHAISFVQYFAS
mmetsp:Transcript_19491/g.40794  ORF Transcript_19491/g.40794 Transcript_19491/m.40794 type:complete len:120 (+) Transcript_19491:386-745(+)